MGKFRSTSPTLTLYKKEKIEFQMGRVACPRAHNLKEGHAN